MIRKTRPTAGNKYFIRKANGGYSTCIKGKPTDKQCNVLSNCVGYACGAFNEELGLGYEKYHLNCNAENFIERAIASGLSVVKKPVVGSILCWQKGSTLGGKDGAGHVAIVIEVVNDNCIKTAESGYGSSKPFWITTRYNNNGRWGLNKDYKVRGFIVNPKYPVKPTPTPKPKFKVGDYVVPTKLVDYKGTKLHQYDSKYQIIAIDKRGNMLGAVRGTQRPIWAILPDSNIKKVS